MSTLKSSSTPGATWESSVEQQASKFVVGELSLGFVMKGPSSEKQCSTTVICACQNTLTDTEDYDHAVEDDTVISESGEVTAGSYLKRPA